MRDTDISAALLAWYDQHARALPWRVPPGSTAVPDPYRVWLSEVMLQQTTVAAVRGYFDRFTTRWPTVEALAAADDGDVMAQWAGLGYYARARNLLACARQVAGRGFPDSEAALLKLPGIGPYTAAAVAAIAFDRRAVVVDGNVERVMARLFDISAPLPGAKPRLKALADRLTPDTRSGDYAQAVMDLGATVCTPKSPACGICPLVAPCTARRAGTQADRPVKAPKQPKPTRHGIAYVVRNSAGDWLVERRPPKGLLGGMLGFPTTDWADAPTPAPPVKADWQVLNTQAEHTFTHFHLRLAVHVAQTDAPPSRGEFIPLDPGDLPTAMRKVHALADSLLD